MSLDLAFTDVSRVRALAHDFLEVHPPASLPWSWRSAIFLHGAVSLGAATGDVALLSAVHAFFENPRHRNVAIRRSDAAACALPALSLYEATGERVGLRYVERALRYLEHAPASPVGAVFHLGSELWARPLPNSVWADSMMMVGVLTARAANVHRDTALRDKALSMMRAFIMHLWDPGAGLFRHADIPSLSLSFPTRGAFWLRGNGWMFAAVAEMCEVLDLAAEERADLARVFEPAARALSVCVRNDGSWPNMLFSKKGTRAPVVVSSKAPIESSGTALVAAGMVGLTRAGVLADPRYFDIGCKAFAAASTCLARDVEGRFVLRNTKGPTNAGPSFQYDWVPESVNADYGVGALMLAAAACATSSARSRRGAA